MHIYSRKGLAGESWRVAWGGSGRRVCARSLLFSLLESQYVFLLSLSGFVIPKSYTLMPSTPPPPILLLFVSTLFHQGLLSSLILPPLASPTHTRACCSLTPPVYGHYGTVPLASHMLRRGACVAALASCTAFVRCFGGADASDFSHPAPLGLSIGFVLSVRLFCLPARPKQGHQCAPTPFCRLGFLTYFPRLPVGYHASLV